MPPSSSLIGLIEDGDVDAPSMLLERAYELLDVRNLSRKHAAWLAAELKNAWRDGHLAGLAEVGGSVEVERALDGVLAEAREQGRRSRR